MYNLLIFLGIAFFGILVYFLKKKSWKSILVLLIILIGVLLIMGFRFTAPSSLPFGSKVIKSINTAYGKAILYEDKKDNSFGLAKVNQSIGFIYYLVGGTSDYSIDENAPFQAVGHGNDDEDGFMVGVKTSDENIKYIVVGNHLETLSLSESYIFSIETVEKYPDSYQIEEVVANYAFFILDEYSEATWTIRALDKDGNLVADQLFGTGESRYIEW